MLDGKACKAHFPDDPAYGLSSSGRCEMQRFEFCRPRQGVSNAAHLHERCDLICPDLPKSPSGLHFAQVAAPVHVHLRPSCTQSQFTRPILFNPRIMQRLITFSMDCTHASPRSLAEAVAVVACPS
jgi:hypothetical protein